MPHRLSGHAALDSLSNLAASLNAGKDKQAGDAFFIPALGRDQIESLYRGDWLARKIVDIVPYDCVREWRQCQGEAGAVSRVKALESRLNLRRAVQRAMVMGRLYGGGALIVGTRESDPAALAAELRPEALGEGGLAFLHPVSRWQLAVDAIERDPLSPWYGEPKSYEVSAPERGPLRLHPSRVIRFLGAPLADPGLAGADTWSDSVLVALYDAIHAVALTTTGATSLVHEAKVDVVTVPNLSEHLSNAATTAQLSARFGYAAAMKSLNNLLLLGDGETWARQRVDFAGLPEMVRTFLQVAAGAADIPVTRLLGQSPAGLSATGVTLYNLNANTTRFGFTGTGLLPAFTGGTVTVYRHKFEWDATIQGYRQQVNAYPYARRFFCPAAGAGYLRLYPLAQNNRDPANALINPATDVIVGAGGFGAVTGFTTLAFTGTANWQVSKAGTDFTALKNTYLWLFSTTPAREQVENAFEPIRLHAIGPVGNYAYVRSVATRGAGRVNRYAYSQKTAGTTDMTITLAVAGTTVLTLTIRANQVGVYQASPSTPSFPVFPGQVIEWTITGGSGAADVAVALDIGG